MHPNQISQWKQELLSRSEEVFSIKKKKEKGEEAIPTKELYAKIGQLEMERDFLKKKLTQMGSYQVASVEQKRQLIDKEAKLSIRQQCVLLCLCRSSYYFRPQGEKEENLEMMRLMDQYILEDPTSGVLTMQDMLEEKGYKASYERVRRLMRKACISPDLSQKVP